MENQYLDFPSDEENRRSLYRVSSIVEDAAFRLYESGEEARYVGNSRSCTCSSSNSSSPCRVSGLEEI